MKSDEWLGLAYYERHEIGIYAPSPRKSPRGHGRATREAKRARRLAREARTQARRDENPLDLGIACNFHGPQV